MVSAVVDENWADRLKKLSVILKPLYDKYMYINHCTATDLVFVYLILINEWLHNFLFYFFSVYALFTCFLLVGGESGKFLFAIC